MNGVNAKNNHLYVCSQWLGLLKYIQLFQVGNGEILNPVFTQPVSAQSIFWEYVSVQFN